LFETIKQEIIVIKCLLIQGRNHGRYNVKFHVLLLLLWIINLSFYVPYLFQLCLNLKERVHHKNFQIMIRLKLVFHLRYIRFTNFNRPCLVKMRLLLYLSGSYLNEKFYSEWRSVLQRMVQKHKLVTLTQEKPSRTLPEFD